MKQIIECVPNFSEGSNTLIIDALKEVIATVDGVKLLHVDSGKAANRTVFTYAGELNVVFKATYKAIQLAVEQIDMRSQKGEHPRIGACDVCPFVPISGISLEELIPLVNSFAQKVSSDFKLPIFLYEESASIQQRKNLANHRVGNYEALEKRMYNQEWLPDFGKHFNAKSGGTVMGARNFLVAYNINLASTDVQLAKEIAYDIRELGRPLKVTKGGKRAFKKGLLKKVKAIGWYIDDFKKAQVSINLTDYKTTSLHEVFETAKELALQYNTSVTGSELIGLIPKEAILQTGQLYHKNDHASEKELIQLAIDELGLSELYFFDPNKRILEFVLNSQS